MESSIAIYQHSWEAVSEGNDFTEKYQDAISVPTLKVANDLVQSKLSSLKTCVTGARKVLEAAASLKIEAMFVQAHRTKIRKTQKELIGNQFADMASCDIPESLIQPLLLKFAKNLLN